VEAGYEDFFAFSEIVVVQYLKGPSQIEEMKDTRVLEFWDISQAQPRFISRRVYTGRLEVELSQHLMWIYNNDKSELLNLTTMECTQVEFKTNNPTLCFFFGRFFYDQHRNALIDLAGKELKKFDLTLQKFSGATSNSNFFCGEFSQANVVNVYSMHQKVRVVGAVPSGKVFSCSSRWLGVEHENEFHLHSLEDFEGYELDHQPSQSQ